MKYSQKTLHSSPERARYRVSFVSSKGNILCRLVKIELYKIFAIINRAIKGLHYEYRLMPHGAYNHELLYFIKKLPPILTFMPGAGDKNILFSPGSGHKWGLVCQRQVSRAVLCVLLAHTPTNVNRGDDSISRLVNASKIFNTIRCFHALVSQFH